MAAGRIDTGSIARALELGVNSWVGQSYNEYDAEYKDIFEMVSSDRNYEEDVMLSTTGLAAKKAEGSSIQYDDFAQEYIKRYVHTVYALGFIITREAIEDNLYMKMAEDKSKALGRSLRQTKENVAANVLNRAFNASYTGGDGVELCSTAHPLGKGGTLANELSTPADLSEASLEQACIDIQGFVDEAGLLIQAMPRKLIIPKELCFEAERIMKSTLQNDTANNAINALRSKGMLPEGYVVNHYLTDQDAFFIKTDVQKGMRCFERRMLEVQNDTADFDTENMKFKATERYAFGWTDPRGIFGSPGA